MRLLTLLLFALLPGVAAAQDLLFFRSPSGNIHCLIATGEWAEARCDLAELTMSYPRPPADCELDWGSAFGVGLTGPGAPICAGDTVQDPNALVLGYGQSVSLGGFTCTSAQTGMTCVNLEGHGFSVARARQRVF